MKALSLHMLVSSGHAALPGAQCISCAVQPSRPHVSYQGFSITHAGQERPCCAPRCPVHLLCCTAAPATCRLTLLSSSVPSAGVTSFMLTTCSSTGGNLAPVPCAPTCGGAYTAIASLKVSPTRGGHCTCPRQCVLKAASRGQKSSTSDMISLWSLAPRHRGRMQARACWQTHLHKAANCLLPDGCKVLQRQPMRPQSLHHLQHIPKHRWRMQ